MNMVIPVNSTNNGNKQASTQRDNTNKVGKQPRRWHTWHGQKGEREKKIEE